MTPDRMTIDQKKQLQDKARELLKLQKGGFLENAYTLI